MARNWAVLTLAMTLFVVLGGSSAEAKGPMTGATNFVVTCRLPEYPSFGNTTSCGGNGTAHIVAVGNGGTNSAAVCLTLCLVTAKKISYIAPCFPSLGLLISAFGSFTMSNLTLLPSLHPAHLWIPFTLLVVGTVHVMVTGKLSGSGNKTLTDEVTGEVYQDAVGDVASGAFVPISIPPIPCNSAPLNVAIQVADVELA
jgi:hypothetical protein